ncbi:hypothetical protein HZ326_6082 [Fusarium oxysporum f. sp. albedinis]|nr:hypothetical protein HZ326_6082 [Fusarium oxysporum f. sp. albedinis]
MPKPPSKVSLLPARRTFPILGRGPLSGKRTLQVPIPAIIQWAQPLAEPKSEGDIRYHLALSRQLHPRI